MEMLLSIGMYHYLAVALFLFCVGLFGVLLCKSLIKIFLCWQMILSAIGMNFVVIAVYTDVNNLNGFSFQLFMAVLGVLQVILIGCLLFKSKGLKG